MLTVRRPSPLTAGLSGVLEVGHPDPSQTPPSGNGSPGSNHALRYGQAAEGRLRATLPRLWPCQRMNHDPLPEDNVKIGHAMLQSLPTEVLRSPGRFRPELAFPEDADAQTRMLAFAGRAH